MASLKQLKMRIASVKSTQKITKAMKMVAAAKLRRASEAAAAARPYSERMASVLASLASRITPGPESPKLLGGTGKDQVHLLVVASSERGLCGAFNTNIVRLARKSALEMQAAGKTVKFYIIGRKGRDQLSRTFRSQVIHSIEPGDLGKLKFADAQDVAADLIARYEAGEYDVAHLFYSKFVSVLTQEPTQAQIIPVPAPTTSGTSAGAMTAAVEYEPDEDEILAELLPRNIAVQLLRAQLENAASEQGSKMTAMDNATRNAGDMINKLTILYNRTRQAAITTELVEIISGAEAL